MKVYYAQRAFHDRCGRWAETNYELDAHLAAIPTSPRPAADAECGELDACLPEAPTMEVTPDGFEAQCLIATPDGPARWHVRQDSRLWKSTPS